MSAVLQQLRIRRRLWRAAITLLLFFSLIDHAGAFGYHGDDWRRFDRQTVAVGHVIDGVTFETGDTVVRLLGVRATGERTTKYTRSNLELQNVILRLDTPQTRDAAGRLLAYAYLSPSDCWNLDLIRDGYARADRQSNCSMLPLLVATDTAAKRKSMRLSAGDPHS